MRRSFPVLVVGLLTLASLAFVACGDDGENGNGDEPTATSADGAPTEAPAEGAVGVRLFEWTLEPDPASAPAGVVAFNAENIGGSTHELVVVRTDLAPDALPTLADGSVDEAAAGIEIVAEAEDIGPGLSDTLDVDLADGPYVLICNIVEETETEVQVHYAEGMYAAFDVTE